VLAPNVEPSSRSTIVFTDSSAAAVASTSSTAVAAASLWGIVTA
jgi:hypothetical protein